MKNAHFRFLLGAIKIGFDILMQILNYFLTSKKMGVLGPSAPGLEDTKGRHKFACLLKEQLKISIKRLSGIPGLI